MKYYYDLHIHSCLSPCGDDEMTPNNIVNMAKLNELSIIAVTDHNSVKNVPAVMKVAEALGGLIVVPGMELTTEEEIHLLCYFPDLESAFKFNNFVDEYRMKVKNKPHIFGEQRVLNESDEEVEREENLLILSTQISLDKAREMALKFGGVAVPAHIDKPSNGIISILGGISHDMGFHTVEISPSASSEYRSEFEAKGYRVLTDTDSHFLESLITENKNYLTLNELSIKAVLAILKSKFIQGEIEQE